MIKHCAALFILIVLSQFVISQPRNEVQKPLPDWCLGPFVRPAKVNPVLSPRKTMFFDSLKRMQVDWESNDVFNPAATVFNDKVYVLYRAEDRSGTGIGGRTSRIGIAESSDGINMKRDHAPVLYPKNDHQKDNEWPGGCEDPRVTMTDDGTYVMMYTQWNRKLPRLAVATSKDLRQWTKHGPIFEEAYNGKFFNIASKSASIITELKDGRLVMAKFDGKYFMYWGEHHVYAATSTDLINWYPLIEADSSLKRLISPRKNHFDSHLTECGPPAVITDKGIVLLYNGKNLADEDADENYTLNSYCGGQVLFDRNDPTKAIARLDKPFMVPQESFEKSGQYPAGTVFLEGLVFHKNKWFLYYGCADSRVGVAIYDPGPK